MFYSTKTLETKSIKYYLYRYLFKVFLNDFCCFLHFTTMVYYKKSKSITIQEDTSNLFVNLVEHMPLCAKKKICVQTSLKRYFFSTKHVWHSYLKFFPFFLIQSETSVDTGNLASASASSKIQQQPLLRAVASMAATSSSTTTAR